jgi:hypothetical protein
MQEGYKTYRTLTDQSVYDICLNTYGTLDLLSKLMKDNNIRSFSRRLPIGSLIKYDERYVSDQKFSEHNYVFATKANPPGTLLLDLYPNATIACSTRRLSSSYTGAALRLRRAADDKEQDIGFDDDDHLDMIALNKFLSGGAGYVIQWYDQSGNSTNMVQYAAGCQPLLMVDTITKRAEVVSDGINDWLSAGLPRTMVLPYTLATAVYHSDTAQNGPFYVFSGLGDSSTNVRSFIRATVSSQNITFHRDRYTKTLNGKMLLVGYTDAVNGGCYFNGVPVASAGQIATTDNLKYLQLFARADAAGTSVSGHIAAKMSEFILWNRSLSAEANSINNNINNYFKIY